MKVGFKQIDNRIQVKMNEPSLTERRENVSENIPSDRSNHNKPRLTTILSRDPTPSQRIIRTNSSKGIRVISSRAGSVDKQPHEFSLQSERDNEEVRDEVLRCMRQELHEVKNRYEEKINQELSHQYNLMSVEVERLKAVIADSEARLARKDIELMELEERQHKKNRKTEAKLSRLEAQIGELKEYYEKCYDYTLWRVNDIDAKVGSLFHFINTETILPEKAQFLNEIEYINDLIQSISVRSSAKTVVLKSELEGELNQLSGKLAANCSLMEELDQAVTGLKSITYGNEALSEQLAIFGSMLSSYAQPAEKQQSTAELYEERFGQLMNRVTGTAIEVELIKSTYEKTLKEEEQKLEQMVKCFSSEKLLSLEEKLFVSEQELKESEQQVSTLKMKLAYFQKKSERASEREYQIQSSLAETFSEEIVKEKTKQFEEEKKHLQQQLRSMNEKNKELDRENYLLAQKLTAVYQENKLLERVPDLEMKVEHLTVENINLNEELRQKTEVLEHLTVQMEKTLKSLSKMSELKSENSALKEEVKNLENDLHEYATTFEKQSVIFRGAISQLQSENSELTRSNTMLKQDLETNQSFMENTSILSRKVSQESILRSAKRGNEKPFCEQKYARLKRTLEKHDLPLICEIDATGYLKEERSGMYLVDEHQDLFELGERELAAAISDGLILI